ncbi:MAG: hypothetical protein K8U57_35990 [Planctomycetes bacterium]|nr:hypothetical protein [Planctomycetota bacterium]
MTLIAAIRTADSVVMVADRRITKRVGVEDNVTKLFKVGNTAIGTAAHGVRQLEPHTDNVRFDVYQLMQTHFAAHPFSAESLGAFEGVLIKGFADYRKAYNVTDLPVKPGEIVFQLLFHSFDGGEFRRRHREFILRGNGTLGQHGNNRPQEHGGAHLMGTPLLVDGLTGDTDKRFKSLRADPEIEKLVVKRKEQDIGVVTTAQAKAFGVRLIEVCHDKCEELKVPRVPISRTYDLAVLTAGGVTFGM